MATLALVISLAALVATSSAQSTEDVETVWSSVAYIFYGERLPLRSTYTGEPALTPLGAQQLYEQGTILRARYLSQNANLTATAENITDYAPIEGIESNAIENTQLFIASSTDEWTAESALAFMQGLYPPAPQTYSDSGGGVDGAILADKTLLDYPLNGYQYPKVQTMSIQEPNNIWLQGNVVCQSYLKSVSAMRNDSVVNSVYENTLGFYQNLWEKIFKGAFSLSMANFYYAYDLYDYAQYFWNHNDSATDVMTEVDLAMLREYASLQQRDMNGNLSVSGLADGDMIRAISGRTLAAKVVALFQENIKYPSGNKLNLMFGSYEPFMAYFALADLVSGPSGYLFENLPNPGAAMVWELFSVNGNTSVYPPDSELWVRFLYRNGTDSEAAFTEYPMFGNPISQSRMTLSDFNAKMADISLDNLSGWCQACNSVSIFCQGVASNSGSSSSTYGAAGKSIVTPVVGGIIGAAVAVAVIGLGLLGAMILGGIRVVRHDPVRRNSSLGGFKGAEKMASDTDLAVSKGGARHERVGSWELRDGSKPVDDGVGAGAVVTTTKTFGLSLPKRDDDTISEMNVEPVKPREEV